MIEGMGMFSETGQEAGFFFRNLLLTERDVSVRMPQNKGFILTHCELLASRCLVLCLGEATYRGQLCLLQLCLIIDTIPFAHWRPGLLSIRGAQSQTAAWQYG